MTMILPPTPGEDVQILASHNARLRGHVTGRGPEALTIELEQTLIRRPFRFAAGSTVELEWVHELGVMQISGRVADAREEPAPTLELELISLAEPVERREHERVPATLKASAWCLAQPTRRLSGNTVDLSVEGVLLWLPELSSRAVSLQLTLAFPGGPLHATAEVCWRREPALVGVQFTRIGPDQQVRLVEFLRQPH